MMYSLDQNKLTNRNRTKQCFRRAEFKVVDGTAYLRNDLFINPTLVVLDVRAYSEGCVNEKREDFSNAETDIQSDSGVNSFIDATEVLPEVRDENTTDASSEGRILFPVLPYSVRHYLGLEMRDITVGVDNVACFKQGVEGHVKLHSVGWDPNLVMINHAESCVNQVKEPIFACV